MATTIGPFPLPGVHMPTWVLRFDRHGACTSPATRASLLEQLHQGAYSDLILFAHGWNNDFAGATALYARFLRAFEALAAAHPLAREGRPHAPLFVGVQWPSIWLSFERRPQPAIARSGAEEAASDSPTAQALVERLAGRGGAQAVERLYALLALPRLDEAQANELAGLAAPAFDTLVDDETGAVRDTYPADLLAMLHAMQRATSGAAAAAAAPEDALAPQARHSPALLDPRNLLRLFSVYQMKDRAAVVGAHGVAALLRALLEAAPDARMHALGHSYGCKVMLSAICAPPAPARPLDSLLLLQPAISHLCFADAIAGSGRAGGYRAALERVRPPILCTYSGADFPLHALFHLALRRERDLGEHDLRLASAAATTAGTPPSEFAALGGYGPRGAGQVLIDPMPDAGAAYPAFDGHAVIGLDGSGGRIRSHGDVATPATAWALHHLMAR